VTKLALTAGIPFFFRSLSLSLFSLSRSRSLDLDRRKPVLLFKNDVLSFISTLNYKCCKTISLLLKKEQFSLLTILKPKPTLTLYVYLLIWTFVCDPWSVILSAVAVWEICTSQYNYSTSR